MAVNVVPLIAAAGLVLARLVWSGGWTPEVWEHVVYGAFGVLLIWRRRPLGEYVGPSRSGHITTPTPPILVAAAGWFFIVGMPLILLLVRRAAS